MPPRPKAKSIQLGGYGAFGIAGGFVQAYAGYGWDKHDIDRAGVVEDMEADPDGNHFIAGAKAGYLMPLGTRPRRPGDRARLCQGQGRQLYRGAATRR